MKKVILFLLILTICLFSVFNTFAYGAENSDKAQVLMGLGLFRGTDKGLELDRVPTRDEGGVMLVRLLGMEQTALEGDFSHPFIDVPEWASKYIAFMYENGLTNGTSEKNYSSKLPMSAVHYVTFVLRALGYNDAEGDFYYTESLEKALEVDLITQEQYEMLKHEEDFNRDKMVMVSYNALTTLIKDSEDTLIEKLVQSHSVSAETAYLLGLYDIDDEEMDLFLQDSDEGYAPVDENEFVEILAKAILELNGNLEIDISSLDPKILEYFDFVMSRAEIIVREYTGINNMVKSWSADNYSMNHILSVDLSYYYTKEQLDQITEKAEEIISDHILDEMSDYEKVLAIHDYIINTTDYDDYNYWMGTIPEEAYTIYGVLINNEAVCQGYAETAYFLFNKVGVESMVVTGYAMGIDGFWDSHAWNMVLIEGDYYHIDITFDDPVSTSGVKTLSYDYFNLRDEDIESDHEWDREAYPRASSTDYNYYIINDMVVENREDFFERLHSTIDAREDELTVRIMDFNPDDYMDISKIIFGTGRVESYASSINELLGIIRISRIKYT